MSKNPIAKLHWGTKYLPLFEAPHWHLLGLARGAALSSMTFAGSQRCADHSGSSRVSLIWTGVSGPVTRPCLGSSEHVCFPSLNLLSLTLPRFRNALWNRGGGWGRGSCVVLQVARHWVILWRVACFWSVLTPFPGDLLCTVYK